MFDMPGMSIAPSAGTRQGPRVMTTACFAESTTALTGASGPSHPAGGELALSEAIFIKAIAALAAIEREPINRPRPVDLVSEMSNIPNSSGEVLLGLGRR